MKIAILAAGAAGMYCGSCLRDNTLASALLRAGQKVTLIPLFTPLRTDTADVSIHQVFYGGVNVYLQHATRFFRKTPRLVDWLLDSKWLLNIAARFGATSKPADLGSLTLSILRGEDGPALKELRRLMEFLITHVKPEVVCLPNLMFIGVARLFRHELGLPVVCELTGEDIFLDAMSEKDQAEARSIIRERAADVDRFVASSSYYADRMAAYLGLPRERIEVVESGLSKEYLDHVAARIPSNGQAVSRPPTVGYLARICPEKGLERLVDAMLLLKQKPGMSDVRLRVAGYLGGAHKKWFEALRRRIAKTPLAATIEYAGEVDQNGKLDFLNSIDVFSVPTAYPEAKGIYVLEALAHGVPVVQPAHGSFPELIEQTGGGRLVPPDDAPALADALAALLADAPARTRLGHAGRAAVYSSFTDDAMAGRMLKVFEAARDSAGIDAGHPAPSAPRADAAATKQASGREAAGVQSAP